MRNLYWFWDSALSPERCEEIVEQCKQVEPQKGTTYNGETFGESSHRNSTVRWVQGLPSIVDTVWPYVWEANRQAYNFDISNIFEVQFTEYDATEEQYYKWHHDINWSGDTGFDRKMSVVIQLTDPESYEGGELEFTEVASLDAFKNQGSVITFPSYLQHQVTPVTEGTRHSLVTWVEGPRWR